MGDCLLLTSPVRVLKKQFPQFRVAVLVESEFAACFDGNPDFDEVLVSGKKLWTASQLLSRRFDAILNLHGGPTSLFYACTARGKRIGREQYQYSRLYHGLAPAPELSAHAVETTLALFRWLGVQSGPAPRLRFELHQKEAQRIQLKLGHNQPYIVIHPAALMATKRWAPERFAEIARRLVHRKFRIVWTAGPGEESFVVQAAEKVDGTSILFGLTIPELAELIRAARLYIGNDSGPMHLAAAVGTPVVAVWGSSDSRRWQPWGVAHRVVQNPFECNPCPGYRCLVADSPLCIESVTVQQVQSRVDELLSYDESRSESR